MATEEAYRDYVGNELTKEGEEALDSLVAALARLASCMGLAHAGLLIVAVGKKMLAKGLEDDSRGRAG